MVQLDGKDKHTLTAQEKLFLISVPDHFPIVETPIILDRTSPAQMNLFPASGLRGMWTAAST
jgi:hypothetical protein